ncbi:MAG TPA: EutN/CcmL family microcompartment protein [Bryobacteraceae bacterium]|nr:EutN/CcmL family microcompartment protein [Bryobacteraceae bacterium]
MFLGRVVGRVVSTMKDVSLSGQRLLIVQPLKTNLTNTGKQLVMLDAVGAGAGELIYWCRGREASFPFLPAEVPADNTIVGIVDELHIERGS